jgi:hypothetical protein
MANRCFGANLPRAMFGRFWLSVNLDFFIL